MNKKNYYIQLQKQQNLFCDYYSLREAYIKRNDMYKDDILDIALDSIAWFMKELWFHLKFRF